MTPHKLILVDRDGVINEEVKDGYVEAPQELIIYPRALEAFSLFRQKGYTCAVITNQSVVARGRISLEQLNAIHSHMCDAVQKAGGEIARVFACLDHPDAPTFRRKPNPGMLIEALDYFKAEAAATPMIGDAITDIQAAHGAGCRRYLVMTGKGISSKSQITENLYPVTLCEDILDAALKITSVV